MKRSGIVFIALVLVVGLAGCGGAQPSDVEPHDYDYVAAVPDLPPMQEEAVVETEEYEEAIDYDPNAWNPTAENSFMGLGQCPWDEPCTILLRWIQAYRDGEYAQIYISDPNVPIMWRLTTTGTSAYLVERNDPGHTSVLAVGYSQIIMQGANYFTFGEDLNEEWMPLTIFKISMSRRSEIDEDDERWLAQMQISEEEALRLAAEVFTYEVLSVASAQDLFFQPAGRYIHLGRAYYRIHIYVGERDFVFDGAEISADGLTFWYISGMPTWHLIKDKAAVQILPTDYT